MDCFGSCLTFDTSPLDGMRRSTPCEVYSIRRTPVVALPMILVRRKIERKGITSSRMDCRSRADIPFRSPHLVVFRFVLLTPATKIGAW